MRKWLGMGVPFLMICAAVAMACSDDDDDDGVAPNTPDASVLPDATATPDAQPDTGPAATTGTVKIEVAYSGSRTGALTFGVFTQLGTPPLVAHRMPPGTFTLPTSHTFENIPPGNYFAVSSLDVGNDNFEAPGPEDPNAPPSQITVTAGQETVVTKTLTDPIQDAGADG